MPLAPEQIADGWIEHDGGPCPVPPGSAPTVRLRSGSEGIQVACCLVWEHDGRSDDIIAYKLRDQ